ncbi:MAG: leucyl aminopeptidase [Pseudomonadales bacterium]|nr:leucyl aminopeptidase [Pseudomonadales bacterium]
MKYTASHGQATKVSTPCLVASLSTARQATSGQVREALIAATRDFKDQAGDTLLLALPQAGGVQRVLIAGGCDGELTVAQYRKAVNAAAGALAASKADSAVWDLQHVKVDGMDLHWRISTGLTAISLASYDFNDHKSKPPAARTLKRVTVLHADRDKDTCQKAVLEANALSSGLDFTRDLGNEPPNICNPTWLLAEARKLSKLDKVTVTALDEKRMRELGMGSFLSVSRGSESPGKLIIVQYKGGKRGAAPVALVGKGITFDTGGISLKPGPGMDEMKFDMCGAAAVLGATRAAAEAKLPINMVTLVAAAENMPSGRASRPGDIVKSLSGKTIEILNTDAEGRLVLCDAITYARRYKPSVVIDVATLTGACIIALGSHASGLFSNDDALANDLLSAGDWSGDRAWRLPVWDDYQQQLKSNFADMANVGGREAGSVVAACFLQRFAEDLRWAHMDIAGTAFHGGARKGASGRPVPSLFRFLVNEAGRA